MLTNDPARINEKTGVPAADNVKNCLGRSLSRAAANVMFPAVKVLAFNDPSVEIKAPKAINMPPEEPNTFVAASA